MTAPAALKELEKIEMVRLADNVYHLDHAVSATQKTILDAFGLDAADIKYEADKILIRSAKQKVIKTKEAHERAVDELQNLMDKKKAIQTKELKDAITKNERSCDEIIKYVKGE